MARVARRDHDLGLSAISIEGGLISPDQLLKIANQAPDQKTADDYGCPRGLSLRDEITRYFRIGQAHWQDYARLPAPNFIQTTAFVRKLLGDAFGFDDLKGPVVHQAEDHTWRIALEARQGRVPVVVAAPLADARADAFGKALIELGDDPGGSIQRRSPATLLQSWLNANEEILWGLAFVGDRVRLMRDNASLTRAAHVEADFGAIFRDEMFADFAAIWLLIHASRFGASDAAAADCPLERWREAGQKAGTAARERLRGNVEEALLCLGQGLVEANPDLAVRMAADANTLTSVYEQLLRLVYRLIFLAVAEARGLLHPRAAPSAAAALYAGSYGFSHLRERAGRRSAHDHHFDAWQGARIVFLALERGEAALGLPGLGGLFSRGKTPDLEDAQLSNAAFLGAVARLSWLLVDGGRERINWRDMATEELGSVYEGLLELVPQLVDHGRQFVFAGGDEARGNARKVSGSYYTPDSLVQALLDTALNPLLQHAEAEGGAEAILKLRIIDPACGSGHFLLGAARRLAYRLARLRDPDAPDDQAAMRDVVRFCVHGVDRNPMAVELAKVALWIEAVEPGKPLAFLDANIRCGDSLVGVFDLNTLGAGIPDAAYKPLTGDDPEAARTAGRVNRQQRENRVQDDWVAGLLPTDLAKAAERLHAMPEDNLAQMNAKAQAFERLRAGEGWGARKIACDLYVAAFLRTKQFRPDMAAARLLDRSPTTLDLRTALSGGQGDPRTTALAVDLAEEARAFHWPLEFPDVFARGGFDLVIGNPPWEVMQLSEEEYFAARAPEISSLAGKERKEAIQGLLVSNVHIYNAFREAKRSFEAANEFARASGRFPLTARGKINTYSLFSETFSYLAGDRGRAAIIVPTGIATDATTAPFFAELIQNKRLVAIYSFENEGMIFAGIHHSMKFSLLIIDSNNAERPSFLFFARDVEDLKDRNRIFQLDLNEIAKINPNTMTAPIFRSGEDARLTAKIYARTPVLIQDFGAESSNPWHLEFRQGLFNMTSDSELFKTSLELENGGYSRDRTFWTGYSHLYEPLYEAKMINLYDHRFGDYRSRGNDRGFRVMPETPVENYADPLFEPEPFYWVERNHVESSLNSWHYGWLLAFKDVTSAVSERTMISAFIPRTAVSHKLPLLFSKQNPRLVAALQANLASIVLDYVARTKVGGLSLSLFLLKQFPVLPPEIYRSSDLDFIVNRVLELTYTSYSMAPLARDLGCDGPPFTWNEDRRAELRAELDAWYARAYGLTRDELRYILDPTDVMGPDYPSETFRVLKEKEIRRYGEYRTQRLVLAAWDAQEASR